MFLKHLILSCILQFLQVSCQKKMFKKVNLNKNCENSEIFTLMS